MLKLGDAKADAEKARKRWNVSAASVIKTNKLDMLRKAGSSIGRAGAGAGARAGAGAKAGARAAARAGAGARVGGGAGAGARTFTTTFRAPT